MMMQRRVLYETHLAGGAIIRVVQGDLTQEPVDAIVNAANNQLAHGGGVAGAIVRAGGREIQRESAAWVQQHGPVPTGSAAITGAGRLRCRYVIHTVGPVWRNEGDEDELLASAVTSALKLAAEHEIETISLPGISTGIFGFPKQRGARIILEAVLAASARWQIKEINLISIGPKTANIFAAAAQALWPAQVGRTLAREPEN
jgi:O-acetyl-ADP-ribose deacetylase (regulator of RNase III)